MIDLLRLVVGWITLLAVSSCASAVRGRVVAPWVLLAVWFWIAWVLGGAMVAPLLDIVGR